MSRRPGMASETNAAPSAPNNREDITAASSVDELVLTRFLLGEDKQKMLLAADAGHFSMIRSVVLTSPTRSTVVSLAY